MQAGKTMYTFLSCTIHEDNRGQHNDLLVVDRNIIYQQITPFSCEIWGFTISTDALWDILYFYVQLCDNEHDHS